MGNMDRLIWDWEIGKSKQLGLGYIVMLTKREAVGELGTDVM